MAPNHRRGPWVPEEDDALLQLVHEQGPNNWVRISQHMHFRSPKQCRERFHQNLKPSLNHTPISADEGLMIERMVNEMGKRWAEIARRLGNRSDNAVKNWWNGNMNRKRRGLVVQATGHQRVCNGRVEAPYPRASEQRYHVRRSSASSSISSSSSAAKPVRLNRSPVPVSQLILSERAVSPNRDENGRPRCLEPILTSARAVEPPMTSPAFSEISTLEPPSMVSDHNSVSSASPRTLPSPQMLSIDVRHAYYMEQQRRGSAPTYSLLHHSSSCKEEVYIANNAETEPVLDRHWSVDHDYTLKTLSHSHDEHHTKSIPMAVTSSSSSSLPRDSRMGLQSLLN